MLSGLYIGVGLNIKWFVKCGHEILRGTHGAAYEAASEHFITYAANLALNYAPFKLV